MNVEGAGVVAPARERVVLTGADKWIIKGEALRRNLERGYGRRSDRWGRGLIRDSRDGVPPEAVGSLVGIATEYAVCSFLNRRLGRRVAAVDLVSRAFGDGGRDIVVAGLSMQVKARQRDYGKNLVRRVRDDGRMEPIHGDIHVYCEYLRERQDVVDILGWLWTREMHDYPIVDAMRGDHKNIEVPDWDLLPLGRLVREIKRRRGIV